MTERITLDDEGSYMARQLAESLNLSPERAARFAFMLSVHQLAEHDDPKQMVENILGLITQDDEILKALPRDGWPHAAIAKLLTKRQP